MKTEIRLVCSEGAAYLTDEERRAIAEEALRQSVRAPIDAAFIFNAEGLKIVVRKSEIWIMTTEEAQKGGLPSPSDN